MLFNLGIFNVILTGLAFFTLFTAFQTASQLSQVVLESAAKGTDQNVGVGYVSLSIVYAAFAIFNWFSPVAVLLLGEKYTMFLGSICYFLFVACFMEPRAWSLYLGSVVCGFGAAVLWTAQGAFITRWSDSRNINKHFSIFWALLQLSQIVGGLYVYLSLADVTYIDRRLRLQLFGGMLGCGAVGTLLFLGLRPPPAISQPEDLPVLSVPNSEDGNDVRVSRPKMVFDSTLKTFCRSFKLLPSPIMLCILVTAGFTGVNITFWSSLFGSCIGHTLAFGSRAKSSMGLVVIFVGVGEILGSAITNLRRWISSTGLATIFGYTGAVLGVFFCLLMLPPDSPIRETEHPTYIQPSVELGMFVAVLFGMVDAVWNTQMSVLIGDVYRSRPDDIPVAFALYRCIQSVLAAITFSYCNQLLLQWQVLIYLLWATLGVGCYFYASWLQSTTQ